MATWLAHVTFPDATIRYSAYSTIVNAIDGNVLVASWDERREPDESFPDRAWSAPEAMVLVVIALDRDNISWSALYCPNRCVILGPLSPNTMAGGSDKFVLLRDSDELSHLVSSYDIYVGVAMEAFLRGNYVNAVCGAQVRGDANPIDTDLYTDWNGSHVCRDCLVHESVVI
jgi:hypothetical protein